MTENPILGRLSGQHWLAVGAAFTLVLALATLVIQAILGRIVNNACVGECLVEQDVLMQANMALAAWAVAAMTALSLIIGGIGLYALIATLQAAQRTADIAQEQLDISRRIGADTLDVGKKQVRAYLSAMDAHILITEDAIYEIAVRISIKNTGQSPAKDVQVVYKLLADRPFGQSPQTVDKERAWPSIAAGEPLTKSTVFIGAHDIEEFCDSSGFLWELHVKVHWRDVFNDAHTTETRFSRVVYDERPPADIELRPQA